MNRGGCCCCGTAERAWNAERRFQGQADPPLDEVGRTQAYEVAALVAALRPGAARDLGCHPGAADRGAARRSRPACRCSRSPAAGAVARPLGGPHPRRGGRALSGRVRRLGRRTRREPSGRGDPRPGRRTGLRRFRRPAAVATHRARHAQRDRDGALRDACSGLPQEPHVLGPLANCHWSELRTRRPALATARPQRRAAGTGDPAAAGAETTDAPDAEA